MKYLIPSVSDHDVYKIIHERIRTLTPFCLTRFGDAEIFFLNNNVPIALQQKVCQLWNYAWPGDFDKVRTDICNILASALDSDIIGLLDPNNIICKKLKYDERKWSLPMDKIKNAAVLVCDHQITRNRLFGDIHSFKQLLQGRSVNIISPNVEQLQNNEIERLLETHVTYTQIDNHRETMLDSLKLIQDDIVLFGASLYGKDIGVIMKSYRKIAIDFGATLDGWAGLCTRPWFSPGSEQDYCLIRNQNDKYHIQ
jgi:hypothetical protein